MGAQFQYSLTIKNHPITSPGSGSAGDRRAQLSQTSSGKVLVHNTEGSHGIWVLGGGASVDANVAPTPDNRSFVPSGFSRVIDVGSSEYVSVKVKGASDNHDVIIEEVE